jgi:hypothetical protein
MLQQRYIMNEFPLPLSERADFIIKDLPISEQPDIPTCQNYHFHEKRFGEALPGPC